MIVLGIDPGLANLGWAVVEIHGQSRRLIAGATLRSVSSLSDDVRVRSLLESVATFAKLHQVELVGVEAHVWQGAARSANPEAFRVSRVSGAVEGIAAGLGIPWERVTRAQGLAAVGARTEASANALVARLVALPARTSQHQRDAVMVALAAERVTRIRGQRGA